MIKSFLLISIIFLNPWIWKILAGNFLTALLIIFFTLFICLRKKIPGFTLLFLINLVILIFVFWDDGIKFKNNADIILLNQRHGYTSLELESLYTNRLSQYFFNNLSQTLDIYIKNLFFNLDINSYFFASHPREKPDTGEYEKFYFVFLPFFVIGAYKFIKEKNHPWMIYFILAALAGGLIAYYYRFSSLVFFPFIVLTVLKGIPLRQKIYG